MLKVCHHLNLCTLKNSKMRGDTLRQCFSRYPHNTTQQSTMEYHPSSLTFIHSTKEQGTKKQEDTFFSMSKFNNIDLKSVLKSSTYLRINSLCN